MEQDPSIELSDEKIREQLDLLVQDTVFRSSKRSIEFLRYVVDQTLKGSADQIKERTIGVEVFGRAPSYDTNMDHVVRTAAIELRKRLAIYYGEEKHRSEIRMSLVPGSYVPHFTLPTQPLPPEPEVAPEPAASAAPTTIATAQAEGSVPPPEPTPAATISAASHRRSLFFGLGLAVLVILSGVAYGRFHAQATQDIFWRPILDSPGSVLLAVGDVPNGPPTPSPTADNQDASLPTLQATAAPTVPFADMVTIASVVGTLESHGKKVLIRRESVSSFSDLREGPAVLIGAFNNEWSLRLTNQLRYTLALDAEKHLIYIKDTKNPTSRAWSWGTDQPKVHKHGGPALHDFALISRIWNSDTGHVVIVIGGLYTYGTQAAGEFLTDPNLVQSIVKSAPLDDAHRNLQIVLGTTVTDDTPGPPKVLAVSVE
ncbi:hypothetical protein FTO74_17540 [Granulicella sp. WH15]|uniref:hypothetical protein n=1 Tax=Granulicella sp. WH15 TaxID=2602070 RepID=UPI0013676AB9|nr:hypothetical protein [Granulicella sp. WH15]QHN04965.1 hypothetical protein FTO74_17540 [Granulicella sp. WH15]